MDLNNCITRWRARDNARDGIPGEHALVAAAGGALIVSALFAPSASRATLRAMLGGALLVRAASGRDGLAGLSAPAAAPAPAPGVEPAPEANNPWPFPKASDYSRA